ncbi:hypothetical protein M667_18400 [Cellulophaga baltica NN016038]|nr:hypothetical protein M667_18400 [Cellulophaga baltica NN016038]
MTQNKLAIEKIKFRNLNAALIKKIIHIFRSNFCSSMLIYLRGTTLAIYTALNTWLKKKNSKEVADF